MIAPFWFYSLLIFIGVFGSVATLAWIIITYIKEYKSGQLW
ncbi:hypothetical protein [Aneurinibacillus tyrosinisolvens]|nr:hypothetical protein [Aneurinibacillus tyrosinisolvens]